MLLETQQKWCQRFRLRCGLSLGAFAARPVLPQDVLADKVPAVFKKEGVSVSEIGVAWLPGGPTWRPFCGPCFGAACGKQIIGESNMCPCCWRPLSPGDFIVAMVSFSVVETSCRQAPCDHKFGRDVGEVLLHASEGFEIESCSGRQAWFQSSGRSQHVEISNAQGLYSCGLDCN